MTRVILEINADGAARLSWGRGGVTIPADVAAIVFANTDALRAAGVDVCVPEETQPEQVEASTYYPNNPGEDARSELPPPWVMN